MRLLLHKQHPYEAPRLLLVSPKVLYAADGRSINSLGVSHDFHTESDGPPGCIQISYAGRWDASCTCVGALIKGIIWINGYESHLRTGKSIEKVLRDLQDTGRTGTFNR